MRTFRRTDAQNIEKPVSGRFFKGVCQRLVRFVGRWHARRRSDRRQRVSERGFSVVLKVGVRIRLRLKAKFSEQLRMHWEIMRKRGQNDLVLLFPLIVRDR